MQFLPAAHILGTLYFPAERWPRRALFTSPDARWSRSKACHSAIRWKTRIGYQVFPLQDDAAGFLDLA